MERLSSLVGTTKGKILVTVVSVAAVSIFLVLVVVVPAAVVTANKNDGDGSNTIRSDDPPDDSTTTRKLGVSGTGLVWPTNDGDGDDAVFLSGLNQAWLDYGNDFGNNQQISTYCRQKQTLSNLSRVGGNSLRYWLFVEGYYIPEFDSNGYVTGTDSADSLISDLRRYIWAAQEQGIVINFCLWNGAVLSNQKAINLFWDTDKLQSFIDNALIPIVTALSNETAIMAWEIINEPEGSVQIGSDSEACFDTTPLSGSGAGWTGVNLPMRNILQFISMQASAIHTADPKALVTVGTWSEKSATDNWGYRNYYKDECLNRFGLSDSTIDFYQIHTYDWGGQWNAHSPFVHNKEDFALDKPLVIGEFDEENGGGMTIESLYDYALQHGYDGAWAWTAEEPQNFDGVGALAGEPTVDAISMQPITVQEDCSQTCSDVPPSTDYTCAQQASWEKCDESWMQGYCCFSCEACQGCT